VFSIPAFVLINSNSIGLIFSGLLLLAVILNCFTGVMASSLPAMFPTHIATARWRAPLTSRC
jgi:MHS family proline/betaine transporter-like MFS transporter